jgi:hypothetical protein
VRFTAETMTKSHSTSFKGRGAGDSARKRRGDRRYALIVGIVLILGLGASILAWSSDVARSRHTARLPAAGAKQVDSETRTGNIVVTTDGGCRQSSFDNDTGRVSRAGTPCENSEFSSEKGDPKPKGLERRLDAISKAFSR